MHVVSTERRREGLQRHGPFGGNNLCRNPGTGLLLFVEQSWQHELGDHQLVTNNQRNSFTANQDVFVKVSGEGVRILYVKYSLNIIQPHLSVLEKVI